MAKVLPTLIAAMDQRPVAAYDASASPLPITIPAKGSVLVTLTPTANDPPPVWNSLAAALAGVSARFEAEAVLGRIHQLAGTTSLLSRVVVSSWVFASESRIPAALRDVLFGMDVQLRRGADEEPATLTLMVDDARKTFDFAFGLADILAGQTPISPPSNTANAIAEPPARALGRPGRAFAAIPWSSTPSFPPARRQRAERRPSK